MKIDPKLRHCICGHNWYFNRLDYVRMILFNGITVRCPRCNRLHYYKLVYHAVEEFKETKDTNKILEDSKMELWKYG